MTEEKQMHIKTGGEFNEANVEWNVASSSSLSISNTLNKDKHSNHGDLTNCAAAVYSDSNMNMKEINSSDTNNSEPRSRKKDCDENTNIPDETKEVCANIVNITSNRNANLYNDDEECMDEDFNVENSLSPSLTHKDDPAAENAGEGVVDFPNTKPQVLRISRASAIVDDRQSEIRSNEFIHNSLTEEQGQEAEYNNLNNMSFNAINESIMEHGQNRIDGNDLIESLCDERQMLSMNNLSEALVSPLVSLLNTQHSENVDNENEFTNQFVSTSPNVTYNGDNNINNDSDLPSSHVVNLSSNLYDNYSREVLNPVYPMEGIHDNENTEEEQLMMNTAGVQPNYPLVLIRPLTQTELNQMYTSFSTDTGEEAGTTRERREQNSHGLDQLVTIESESDVTRRSEREEGGERGANEAASVSTDHGSAFPMAEEYDNVVDVDGDEDMYDGSTTPAHGSDNLSLSSVVENDNLDDDDYDEDDEGESSQNAVGRVVNNGGRRRGRHGNTEYDSLRDLIVRTTRALNEGSASSSSSSTSNFELAPRDSFMQRFRRILFILSSRRRRLIRLGLASPDTENPEGESGAVGDIALDPTTSNVSLQQIAQRLNMVDVDLNDLGRQEAAVTTEPEREAEILPDNAIRFDTNLPAEHSYMGNNMNRVCGVNYLDVGQQHNRIMLFMHHALLFPGEVLPFMISGLIINDDFDQENGLFGVCFAFLNDSTSTDNIYGVTCQIYEKGTDGRGNTLVKSRALQRFITKSSELVGPLGYLSDQPQARCYGNVKILPDIYLPEPLKCITMGSLSRFRDSESMQQLYKRYQVAGLPWPAHIYEYYGIASIIEKARTQLAQHKIDTMPTDPTQLSYWLVRNLHLTESLMNSIFLTNSVNVRLELISRTFKEESIFSCRHCSSHIANCRELLAMSKHGVQTQYCNSAGYIHEITTLYQVNMDAILFRGSPSTEFSWFPGYQWHQIVCKICNLHLGWKFCAVKPNLVPKQFYGISSSGIRIRSAQSVREDARLRSIVRLHSRRYTMLEEGGSDSGAASSNGRRGAARTNQDNNAMQIDDDIDDDIGSGTDNGGGRNTRSRRSRRSGRSLE